MWELIALSTHVHPTVRLWANKLINGESIEYGGDPLLDFSIANFLDRIAYKNPKSTEKIQKFKKRMAEFEKPINQYDFKKGEQPDELREEEKFLYQYFKNREEDKPNKNKKDNFDQGEEDSEMERFADQEI